LKRKCKNERIEEEPKVKVKWELKGKLPPFSAYIFFSMVFCFFVFSFLFFLLLEKKKMPKEST
jgi:hypothetical protein